MISVEWDMLLLRIFWRWVFHSETAWEDEKTKYLTFNSDDVLLIVSFAGFDRYKSRTTPRLPVEKGEGPKLDSKWSGREGAGRW